MVSFVPFDSGRPIALSCAGGQCRQFRVQYRRSGAHGWQRYNCFRNEEAAIQCAGELNQQGYQARVVGYRIGPVAA